MALLSSTEPSSRLLNTPLVLTNSLNTPSGQDTSDYFTAHRSRGLGEPYAQTILGKDIPLTSSQPLKGSLLDLPNEILIHILELGYFEFDGDHAPDTDFRTLASKISRKFFHLVLETPSLWSSIQLSFTNIPMELASLPAYLKRSKAHSLALRLSCYWDTETTFAIMDKLVPYINRWKHLTMTINSDLVLTMLENKPAPVLEYLNISYFGHENRVSIPPEVFAGHFPRLKHLCLRNVDVYNLGFSLRELETLEIRGYGIWPTYARLNEMLGGSSNLKYLIIHVNPAQALTRLFQTQSWDNPLPQIILPELRRMTIYTSEWLSSNIARFIRLFACPKLELMFLHESISVPTYKPQSIMVYSRDVTILRNAHTTAQESTGRSVDNNTPRPMPDRFPNHLFLHTCNLYAGCQALFSVNLTTLELHRVHWPTHSELSHLFASLQNLVNLFIFDLDPKRAVLSILDVEENEDGHHVSISNISELEGSISIPRLEHLTIQFHYSNQGATKYYTTGLFCIFAIPALKSLHLKGIIDKAQWKAIVDMSDYSPQYPALETLTLTDMRDIVPTDPQDPYYTDIVSAFPRLHRLSLDGFASSNALLQQLLPQAAKATPSCHSSTNSLGGEVIPFPDLQVLAICNDSFASKPLLHRIIAARESAGKPLRKVILDQHFSTNPESLEWIEEHIEVVEVRGDVFDSIPA